MRRGVIALLIAIAALLAHRVEVDACGDKFLLVGRGVKFQRAYAAVHPASILIYARARRGASAAIADPRLQSSLKAAGHSLSTADSPQGLEQALKSGAYDLVLADVADAPMLEPQTQAAPGRPTVLWVIYTPNSDEAAALQKRFNCRLTASDRSERYLAIIDDTMKSRIKEGHGRARKGA